MADMTTQHPSRTWAMRSLFPARTFLVTAACCMVLTSACVGPPRPGLLSGHPGGAVAVLVVPPCTTSVYLGSDADEVRDGMPASERSASPAQLLAGLVQTSICTKLTARLSPSPVVCASVNTACAGTYTDTTGTAQRLFREAAERLPPGTPRWILHLGRFDVVQCDNFARAGYSAWIPANVTPRLRTRLFYTLTDESTNRIAANGVIETSGEYETQGFDAWYAHADRMAGQILVILLGRP
jgi:hypothetical protein